MTLNGNFSVVITTINLVVLQSPSYQLKIAINSHWYDGGCPSKLITYIWIFHRMAMLLFFVTRRLCSSYTWVCFATQNETSSLYYWVSSSLMCGFDIHNDRLVMPCHITYAMFHPRKKDSKSLAIWRGHVECFTLSLQVDNLNLSQ